MEDMKNKFAGVIAAALNAAPDSTAKAELIEELSDNLYQRYQAELAAGQGEEAAYQAAVDSLGDAGELVAYLRELDPGEPLPPPNRETDDPLGDILRNVEDICRDAIRKARTALDEVKANLEQSGASHWRSGDGEAEVHVDNGAAPDHKAPEEPETELDVPEPREEDKGHGWGFTLGVDVDTDKFFAGGGPKGNRDAVYGFGYDRDKGGFFTQWGDHKDKNQTPEDPDAPISAQALKGIEVQVDGDVTIRMTEPPEGDVVIGGDVSNIEAFRSDDGVLTIRQIRTASSAFLFRRGVSTVDVELDLPCRPWQFLRVNTGSGDVDVNGGMEVELLAAKTGSGDLTGGLPRCRKVYFRSGSGDFDWKGDADELDVETVSGDVTQDRGNIRAARCKTTSGDIHWDGDADQAQMFSISGDVIVNGRIGRFQGSTTSGEIELAGAFCNVQCSSLSGDLRLESDVLPQALAMKTTSGDCEARIPDGGGFTVRYKTTSGSFRSDFFTGRMGGRSNTFTYRGGGPEYHFSSLSGDLALYKY